MKVRIVYEYPGEWPEEGPLRIDTEYQGEITVPPELAHRRAADYLTDYISMFIIPGELTLVLREHPVWRMPAMLHLPGRGEVAIMGSVEVDAIMGEAIPLSEVEIEAIQNRADKIAALLLPSPEAAG